MAAIEFFMHDVKINEAKWAGRNAGIEVLLGNIAPEDVGDLWLFWANRSYDLGNAFERAYDATGAAR